MRIAIVVLALAACDEHGKSPVRSDASTTDVNIHSCTAADGTADVTIATMPPSFPLRRLDAGGLLLSGPVNGAVGAPMSFSLLFTNTDPLDNARAQCCSGPDPTCCGVEGVLVQTDAIPEGSEIGSHPATFKSFSDPTFSTSGTLMITKFVHPFESAPGRIAGSVSAGSGNISGPFDNSFCAILLNATI